MNFKLKETIKNFVKNSKPHVKTFVKAYAKEGDEIIYPEAMQDKFEHWDVKINGQKYDPKALKKILRSDNDVSKTCHWVEIKNGDGFTGWLYSSPDVLLVFETDNDWLIVKKEDLIPFIEQKCVDKFPYIISNYSKYVNLYTPYRRFGRQDSIVLVTIDDLKSVTYKIVKKI